MAMEYDTGEVEIVILGGINKKTGRKNPTELVGYFSHTSKIKTKFGEKPLFVFKTAEGDKGLIGSGNLTKLMETKVPGLLTHVIDTGTTKDVGKGNPMKVYKVGQDRNDAVSPEAYEATDTSGLAYDDEAVSDEPVDEIEPVRAVRPVKAAVTPSAAAQARVQALLNRRS